MRAFVVDRNDYDFQFGVGLILFQVLGGNDEAATR
jgi:hypothetical protein